MSLTLASYFENRRNQFHKNILSRLTRANPFRTLVPMRPFDIAEGQTPTVLTVTTELPTAYEASMTAVADGTVASGNGSYSDPVNCNPAKTLIRMGSNSRTFQLYSRSFETPVFCLSDIKRKHEAVQHAKFQERALDQYLQVWWSDWYRIQNIAMCDNKASTLSGDGLDLVTSTSPDFTDLNTAPTEYCDWPHLEALYWHLIRSGAAEELAIGRANGQPVIPVIANPRYIQRWTKDATASSAVRATIDWYKPAENLKVLGIREAINGFAFIPDLFPVRFAIDDADLADTQSLTLGNTVYPTINENATTGRRYALNPNWRAGSVVGEDDTTTAYEVIQIMPRNVWEATYEPVDPTAFGGLNFNPKTDYVGNFKLINQPTFRGDNDRGNMAYYLADVRVGAKPLYTDLGITLLTKALD